MKKLCLLFAFIFLFLSFASCSSGLEAVTEEANPSVTTKKPIEKKTKETKDAIMQEYDPAEDDEFNVLMIGSSSCYYYVEELYGIADAADIDMKVCNAYYSGCSLENHWRWWKNYEANYQYFETDERGRIKYENYSLRQCLARENWDIISLQQSPVRLLHTDFEKAHKEADAYAKALMKFLKEQFPQSEFFWHQLWAWEMGADHAGMVMDSKEKQQGMADFLHQFAIEMSEMLDVTRVPTGDAWQKVRHNPVIGEVLCERTNKNDHYHDGDVGGGQYLNACVWFETITGQSCLDNTWRPKNYNLDEKKIPLLQKAAHEAVAEMKQGESNV